MCCACQAVGKTCSQGVTHTLKRQRLARFDPGRKSPPSLAVSRHMGLRLADEKTDGGMVTRGDAGLGYRESVHAAAHAVLSVLPLFIMCGSNDVATGANRPWHVHESGLIL